MKPAHEPSSSRPKLSGPPQKMPQESGLFAARCWPSQEENKPWSEISFPPRNLSTRAFDSRAQGFSTPLARRRSNCLPSSPNLVLTRPIVRAAAPFKVFLDSAPCLSRAATSRRAPHWSSEEEHLVNTILNQPNLPPCFNQSAES